ncbi:hypothetical protein [Streptomyces sp. NPDC058657]|uniref:hypothetical protein n=1 Tax=unclassified Streptomyces TaxID=2593676 RepID=UPI003669B2EF
MTSAPRTPLPRRTPRNPKIQEALHARDALAAALTRAGVQLPAMDIRTYSLGNQKDDHDGNDSGDIPYALVHLGVCSAPVAHLLADVISRGIAG